MKNSFFNFWDDALNLKLDTLTFEKMFLSKSVFTDDVLVDGSGEEVSDAMNLLVRLDINHLIDIVTNFSINSISPSDIPQFSNFDDAVRKVPKILLSNNGSMTFDQIGFRCLGIRKEGALKKYGENHSKLASMLCLATVSRKNNKSCEVLVTSFGYRFVALEIDMQNILLKILLLKNPLIQNLLIKANKSKVSYRKEVECLSDKTAIRRLSNCKFLLEFLLEKTKFKYLLKEINWQWEI